MPLTLSPNAIGSDSFAGIPKQATHIEGLDEALHEGLPKGSMTLVSGGPGTGKTMFALEFLVRDAMAGTPGILNNRDEILKLLPEDLG